MLILIDVDDILSWLDNWEKRTGRSEVPIRILKIALPNKEGGEKHEDGINFHKGARDKGYCEVQGGE